MKSQLSLKTFPFYKKKRSKNRVVISIQKIAKIIFCYFKSQPRHGIKPELGITRKELIVNWANYIREVTHWVITSKQTVVRHIIRANESLFGGH
ncbi:hypothetical protein A0H76_375 [Hepatospora eriocheir]|uniref:Uncharacterized protein n=1 Tax=Hepatospora eriocheir TaxID=1081669 RepID=A0A1X0QBJ5_9MICR|nr:hypothetical protein A0H76_375 [Hepatospora eriocheir]